MNKIFECIDWMQKRLVEVHSFSEEESRKFFLVLRYIITNEIKAINDESENILKMIKENQESYLELLDAYNRLQKECDRIEKDCKKYFALDILDDEKKEYKN